MRGLPRVPGDLTHHDCIRVRMPSGVLLPWEFERRGEEVRIEPKGRLVVGGPMLAVQAAAAGVGVAYVIERSITDELTSGQLVRVLADWTLPFPGVCLYYPKQRLHSAGLAAFIAHMRAIKRA
ncbi:MAG: LysR family transcriptional regulator [Caulobacter sp.]|nr:LysR family transcriptional regulator [Caulobacter sp.]